MVGVHNVGNIKTLSLESIISLQKLDINNTEGIERISFDTGVLNTLTYLDISQT